MPTVAVIIPFYNGSRFIERSLRSVRDQTVQPDALVVVDDGSRHDEAAALQGIAAKYGATVITQPNGGQGSARNTGVASVDTDYICFLDQDDFYLDHHIETLLSAVPDRAGGFGWAYADLMGADQDGNVFRSRVVGDASVHPKRDVFQMIGADMMVLPSASIISRSAFLAVGGFDPQFKGYEDDDLFLRLFRRGYNNVFIPEPVTVWCIHSASTSYSIHMSRSRFRYFKKLHAMFPSDETKHWFVLRDVLIPRFHRTFISEAFSAVVRPHSPTGKRLSAHREEILGIAQEYQSIVEADMFVPRRVKAKIAAQVAVLRSGSPILAETALLATQVAANGRRALAALLRP